MGGSKIELARQAIVEGIRLLSASDRFSVVSFDHEVDIVVPATKVSAPASATSRMFVALMPPSTSRRMSRPLWSMRRRACSTFFNAVLVVEELSHVDASCGVLVDVQNTLVINAFARWGNDEIKQRYLPRLAADTVGAYALSEAGSGSDAFALTTRAREDGDDYVWDDGRLPSPEEATPE